MKLLVPTVCSIACADGVVGSAEHDDKYVGGNSGYVKGGSYNAQGTDWSLKDSGNLEIGFWTKLVVGCAAAATATSNLDFRLPILAFYCR